MYRTAPLALLLVTVLGMSGAIRGESLDIIAETSYSIDGPRYYFDYNQICALMLGGDTIVSTSAAGIWARFDRDNSWQQLVGGRPAVIDESNYMLFEPRTWTSIKGAPEKIWRAASGDIVMHILEQLRVLNMGEGGGGSVTLCATANGYGCRCNEGGYGLASVSTTGNYPVGGCYVWSKDSLLVLLHLTCKDGDRKCRKIFPIPTVLCHALDSVNVKHACSFPAYGSAANAIWVPIWGYQYIYVIDTMGIITDSLLVDRADYVTPPLPCSRLQTQLVWREWLARWTPIRNFNFVAPGYFMLQYRTGREAVGEDTVALYSTAVWNADRQPVELEVDPHWQVAGVQPDGRIIFAHYRIESDDRKIVLTVTRIVP